MGWDPDTAFVDIRLQSSLQKFRYFHFLYIPTLDIFYKSSLTIEIWSDITEANCKGVNDID